MLAMVGHEAPEHFHNRQSTSKSNQSLRSFLRALSQRPDLAGRVITLVIEYWDDESSIDELWILTPPPQDPPIHDFYSMTAVQMMEALADLETALSDLLLHLTTNFERLSLNLPNAAYWGWPLERNNYSHGQFSLSWSS